ncbi:extracellular solute-binding protein, partial [Rhizobium sp. NPDC092017]
MKHITQILAAAAISMVVTVPAYAETTLTVHYPMPGFFKNVMDTISKKFMEENPDIKIQFAAPSATYEEGIQTILRQAGTSEMPDVTFIGLNRLRMMDERNVAVDLGPLVKKEGNMAEKGFSDTILKLAQVKGKQVGLAFATSNPIMYYNADLVKAAGGNPDNPPKTWDEVIALAGKIKALGNGVDGMDFRWQGDDWMFSALLFGAGGKMLSDDESKVAFNGPEGQKAVEMIQRFVKEGG